MTVPRPTPAIHDPTRQLLATTPVPLAPHAVVTTFTARLGEIELKLQYGPDRVLLTHAGFEAYVTARATTQSESMEALTGVVAGDIANELVPKWSRVTLTRKGAVTQSVVAEDRQPGWNHPTLLSSVLNGG
jgi:hypothetical protein